VPTYKIWKSFKITKSFYILGFKEGSGSVHSNNPQLFQNGDGQHWWTTWTFLMKICIPIFRKWSPSFFHFSPTKQHWKNLSNEVWQLLPIYIYMVDRLMFKGHSSVASISQASIVHPSPWRSLKTNQKWGRYGFGK
jgi:hypothetical protein